MKWLSISSQVESDLSAEWQNTNIFPKRNTSKQRAHSCHFATSMITAPRTPLTRGEVVLAELADAWEWCGYRDSCQSWKVVASMVARGRSCSDTGCVFCMCYAKRLKARRTYDHLRVFVTWIYDLYCSCVWKSVACDVSVHAHVLRWAFMTCPVNDKAELHTGSIWQSVSYISDVFVSS